jgi:uncharacterized Fe-S cluster protein YjdI
MEPGEKKYKNEDITVYWKPSSCIHASTCVNELPLVFSPEKRPWVTMENGSTDDIIEVVDKCPVDALTWKWNNETKNNEIGVEHPNHINNRRRSIIREEINESDASANIKVIENGPLIINGKFFIERENGTKSKFNGTVSICRCGRSKLPPFCDGSHRNL